MNKSSFLRIGEVVRFIETVFGDKQSFEIGGGDELIRSEGRRAEDMATARTFLEQKSSNITFSITFRDDDHSGMASSLPDVFSNPDYARVLRNKYRELNRTEIQYWKIDFLFTRTVHGNKSDHQVVFRFTVGYGGEY